MPLVINSLTTAGRKFRFKRPAAGSGAGFLSRINNRTAAGVAAVAVATPIAVAKTRHHHKDPEEPQPLAATHAPPAPPEPPRNFQPTQGQLTSMFGERWGEMHQGIDVAAPIGTPIVAIMDGVVLEAGPASGFGQWVRVQQPDGTVTVFGHVDQFFVVAGQPVKAGQPIATVGNQGQSTGPHLHLEVWLPDGTKIDPLPWLAGLGINFGPLAV
jgi:murein DD-endopeptidase MepM/ murein hydrolase activator NlpD